MYPATSGSGSGCACGSVAFRFFPWATLVVGAGGAHAMGSGRAGLAGCVLAWQTAWTAACCSPLSESQPWSSGSRASEGTTGTL